MNNVLEQMISKYDVKNEQDQTNAIKEVIQEIVLCGLSRGKFFDEAAFYGGTALRIFYGLDRFSEDLDFALVKPNKNFDLEKYFPYIENEANSYGLNLTIKEKEKSKESNIMSAFLKGDTKEHILAFFSQDNLQTNNRLLKDIKIKLEIDVNPPSGARYEYKTKLLPSIHQVRLYDKSSLFAGKIHAILCRNWNKRTKGRDLYDYIFYLSREISVNMELVKNKLLESKFISNEVNFTIENLKELLVNRFKGINYEVAVQDVVNFIKDLDSLQFWSAQFFIEITESLKAC